MRSAPWAIASNYGRCILGLLAVVTTCCASAVADEITKSTFTFKKVGELEIKLDVYRGSGDELQPVLVWIHGGGLILGGRGAGDKHLRETFAGNGSMIVSIDYRLAPETKLPEIIADIEDAFRFIREQGPTLFRADPNRIAVAGNSAGGYLALAAGHRVEPRPAAVLSLYGFGDLAAPWCTEPSPHPRHNKDPVTREVAFEQVRGPEIIHDKDRKGDGLKFYYFCRQQGYWTEGISGWNPKADAEKLKPFAPIANVNANYPPTFMIHGEKDIDVPPEESEKMAAKLQASNVDHRLIVIKNGGHGFGGADPKEVDHAFEESITFLKKSLRLNQQ